jgi:hypothetical protein
VPYVCPFCGEEDLRPADEGRWHCRGCLRLFSLTFHGVVPAASPYPQPASASPPSHRPSHRQSTPAPTPASGIRLPVTPDAARADALTDPDDDAYPDDAYPDDEPTPGSPR